MTTVDVTEASLGSVPSGSDQMLGLRNGLLYRFPLSMLMTSRQATGKIADLPPGIHHIGGVPEDAPPSTAGVTWRWSVIVVISRGSDMIRLVIDYTAGAIAMQLNTGVWKLIKLESFPAAT